MTAYIKHIARAGAIFCIFEVLSAVVGLESSQALEIACSAAIVSLIVA